MSAAKKPDSSADTREIEWISLDLLRFDPENPRLPVRLAGATDKAILAWLARDGTIVDLMRAIGEQGYFPGEPVLVVPSGNKFIVVEGNRRLAAVRLLNDPAQLPDARKEFQEAADEARKPAPKALPSLRFDSRDEIVLYLGYRHVTGIKEWDPLAKARYLGLLIEGEPTMKKCAALARSIGSRADYVARLLTALRVYQRVEKTGFFERELGEAPLRFSVFSTALSYESVADFVGLKGSGDLRLQSLKRDNAEKLFRWLFKPTPETNVPRISESRKIRTFSRVVASRPALKAFEGGKSLEEAELLTGAPEEAFGKAVAAARDKLDTALSQAPLVEKFERTQEEVLKEISTMSSFLLDTVRRKLR